MPHMFLALGPTVGRRCDSLQLPLRINGYCQAIESLPGGSNAKTAVPLVHGDLGRPVPAQLVYNVTMLTMQICAE